MNIMSSVWEDHTMTNVMDGLWGAGTTEQFHNSDGWLAAAAVRWTTAALEAAPCRRFIRSG